MIPNLSNQFTLLNNILHLFQIACTIVAITLSAVDATLKESVEHAASSIGYSEKSRKWKLRLSSQ